MTDRSAFDEFVHARSSALARTAYLLTGNHHVAEDLVQHALMHTARRWERITTSPEAYARRVMYHANISWWRKRRFTEVPLESYDAPQPPQDSALRVSLERALAQLTPKQRTVLVLRFFEDLTEAQTADAIGISVSTVKSTARHALSRLRTLAPDLAPDLVEADS